MPKSRKRKPRKARRSASGSRRRQLTDRAGLDELRPWIEVMLQADAAEARGDAALALRWLNSRPLGLDGKPCWRLWRLRALWQLVTFERVLPGWVYSRWILAQALQDLRVLDRHQQAIQAAARVRGSQPSSAAGDAIDARCKVVDEDWVYRQAFLYELDGLESFLGRVFDALVGKADRIREWAGAPMGGYQLLGRDAATVMWRDLQTDERFAVANNGCGVLLVPGEFVIGRRVPIDGGSMFESVPLLVPRTVAEQVARAPARWLDVLADAEAPISTGGHTFDLLSDVSPALWLYFLNGGQPTTVTPDLVGSDALARQVLSCAREALAARRLGGDDPESLDPWPCLGAAVLEPDVCLALIEAAGPTDREVLAQLAEGLPDPAGSVLRAVGESPRDAA